MTAQVWSKLTVPLLKTELTNRGLPTTGLKKDLVARLEASDAAVIHSGDPTPLALREESEESGLVGGDVAAPQEDQEDKIEAKRGTVTEASIALPGDQVPSEPTPPLTLATTASAVQDVQPQPPRKRARESSKEEEEVKGREEQGTEFKRVDLEPKSPSNRSERKEVTMKDTPETILDHQSSLPEIQRLSTASTSDPHSSATAPSAEPSTSASTLTTAASVHTVAKSQESALAAQSVPESSASEATAPSSQPPSSPPEASSIYISNLVRPFTVPQLKEKLEEYGSFSTFWIDAIKSHCYITVIDTFSKRDIIRTHFFCSQFDSTSSASKAFQALSGTLWPSQTGKPLKIHYVPSDKVSDLIREEESVNISVSRGAPRVRLDLRVQWRERSDGGGGWEYTLEGGQRESSFGVGILKEERFDPIRPTLQAPTGPRNPQIRNRPAAAPQDDGRGPRFAPLSKAPLEAELQELETKMRLERRPLGGPEKYFKKTRAIPSIFYRGNSREEPPHP